MATKSVPIVVCDQCGKHQPKRTGGWLKLTKGKKLQWDFCCYKCMIESLLHDKEGYETKPV